MGHRPVDTEIDVAASFALAHFGRDDFSEADFEYLYAGPGEGGRVLLRPRTQRTEEEGQPDAGD